MKLKKLSELFDITYGTKFDMNKMSKSSSSNIAFVSRSSKNNGVVDYVDKYNNTEPLNSGLITVTLGGSYLLASFLQPKKFYTGQNVAVLYNKTNMTDQEKLFYCLCIEKNRFRYGAFGREANRTLKDILVPDLIEIPQFVREYALNKLNDADKPLRIKTERPLLNTSLWKEFRYDEIFDIQKGYYNKKPPATNDKTAIPFIGATDKNNGITAYISIDSIQRYSKIGTINPDEPIENKIFKGNCITVSNNGSVGEAFYQEKDFTCTHDVNPLYLLNYELNKYIAMFLCVLIKQEKYRWNYGRKWRPVRMPKSIIKLPVKINGELDWDFMENYIKTIPYSSSI